MCQGWVDGRLGFVGGKCRRDETAVDSLNREFLEESGTAIIFTNADFIFARHDGDKISHFFVKLLENQEDFIEILVNFHRQWERKAYVEEIFGLVGVPIWIEAPDVVNAGDVWGLPRFLSSHDGGAMTPTLACNYCVREQLLMLLMKLKLIDNSLMRRIILHANSLDKLHAAQLPSFEEFMSITGVSDILKQ